MDEISIEAAKSQLSKNIKDIRVIKKISQATLAERSGFDVRYIQRVERAPQNLTLANIARISSGLGVSLQELFSGVKLPKRKRRDFKISNKEDALKYAIEVLKAAIESEKDPR